MALESRIKIIAAVKRLKKQHKRIGFCYGVFDMIHAGHIKHLEVAKQQCDILIVGVTSDEFVKKRKGSERPIFNEKSRAYIVSQLKPVDFVFVRNDDAAISDILKIKPTYCIKGGDYLGSKDKYLLLENEAVRSVGGKMVFTKTGRYLNFTTTKIIKKLSNEK